MNRDTFELANLLYAHDWETTKCKCGWEPTPLEERSGDDFFNDHVDHQAAEAIKAGWHK